MGLSQAWNKVLPEVPIKRNEPAKYSGVLIPEENYRSYRNNMALDNAIANQDLQKNQLLCEENKSDNVIHIILWTVVGFSLGALLIHH